MIAPWHRPCSCRHISASAICSPSCHDVSIASGPSVHRCASDTPPSSSRTKYGWPSPPTP
ncbi:hypothetical protein OV079_20955 [Nannocystis pusilla]|uniref:Uncharacterized protein n=1 Tax=Nannocystis pusilla TaxID=889268 RepID=A0A9X3ERR1_9BACT|nr:hypothetical protein [Nannocystis pusilla]MCY1007980.1 hypothetical protein [Nannocystis pusilla]